MNIHQQFVKLGSERRKLTNELLALLPEIYEKRIYKEYAATIVEYAGKFGGLSKGVVLKRLRLEKYLENKPGLREAIKSEGVHKVGLVAKLATAETENLWLDKVQNMSKAALQELSKEVRMSNTKSLFGEAAGGNLCKAVPIKISLELDEEMSGQFLKLKKKFGGNLSNKEVMKKILEVAESVNGQAEVTSMKVVNGTLVSDKVIPGDNFEGVVTRYIPAKIKQKIIASSHGLCTYPNCNRPVEIFHHTDRFANSRSHESLKPLCKIHHEFMHNGLVENEQFESKNWSLQLSGSKLQQVDQLYRKYRLNFRR